MDDLQKAVTQLAVDVSRIEAQQKERSREYARRLKELNHSRAQTRETQALYLPRVAFENELKEWTTWRRGIDKELDTNNGKRAMMVSIISAVIAVSGFVGTVLNYALQ
jgi:hypothetical protein